MSDSYLHIGDFEKFVRDRFKNIVGGEGPLIPRIAVKIALDDVFKTEEQSEDIVRGCDCLDPEKCFPGEKCPIHGK